MREHAPGLVYEPGERQLPVDYRRCRDPACADAPDDRDLDAHRSDAGERATVFTRVLRRGGRTYIQYWLYYPDSNTAWAGSDEIWEQQLPAAAGRARSCAGPRAYPGFHEDDWEGYQVRIDPDGRVWARATSHGHYQGCKQAACRNRWIGASGLDARVAREPRRPHPGGASAAAGACARRAAASTPAALQPAAARGGPARAHLDRGGPAADPARDAAPGGYRPQDDERHAAVGEGGVPGARERQVVSVRRGRSLHGPRSAGE